MHIGLIGLGTMGAALARNAARNGATVSIYNRTREKTDAFAAAYGSEGRFVACTTLKEFVDSLPRPRSMIIMVNAGSAVDAVIAELLPLLSPNDAIIDAGNSHFTDTDRRIRELQGRGVEFLGMGVSGGEEGALLGPSMMPGGSREVYDRLLPLLQKMAARDGGGGKCIAYMGTGGAGHFVKMVHNGIEYGDMQLIAESYHLLKSCVRASNAELSEIFARWNRGRELKSFLLEITAKIFEKRDELTGSDLIDCIRSEAGQKGTGKWTTVAALDAGVAVPTITAAVDARLLSKNLAERVRREQNMGPLELRMPKIAERAVRDALLLSKICAYAQGFSLIQSVSALQGWQIDLPEVCRIWRGGCIIRSSLLKVFEEALRSSAVSENILFHSTIAPLVRDRHARWRKVIAAASSAGIPIPAHAASLTYFDALRSGWLPQNLTQAQRDFFGAHGFERTDTEGIFHGEWE